MKVKLRSLLSEDTVKQYGRWKYVVWDDIDGYVDSKFLYEEHFSSVYMIVIMYQGNLYGFEDWMNSEGENGISEEYSTDEDYEVELRSVAEVQTVTYEYL
jgi:hypothetical protein